MDRNNEKLSWGEAVLTDPTVKLPMAKVLASYLVHRFDRCTLAVEISEATLAADLGCSVSTIKRAISILRKKWLIVTVRLRGANVYRPRLNDIEASKERMRQKRAARAEARMAERDNAVGGQNWSVRGAFPTLPRAQN